MASSYMLERELLGSARNIIDVNSNTSLVPPSQFSLSTYRNPYAGSTCLPYIPNGLSSSSIGLNNPSDSFDSRKALADVSQ